ncbi:MAG: hypothetical protein ABJF88_18835 [Rhodothermales bacterium]
MANIPVERKGGTPWWTWLLALLAIAGLIWLIAELFDDEPDEDDIAVVDPVEPIDQPEPMEMDDEVTSFAALANGTALVGREVDLDGMRVIGLTGDSSFAVGPGTDMDEAALIVLEDMGEWRVGPGDGSDGTYDVNDGNMLDIAGTIQAFDSSVPDYADMSDVDRDRAMRQGVYISANSVDLEKN